MATALSPSLGDLFHKLYIKSYLEMFEGTEIAEVDGWTIRKPAISGVFEIHFLYVRHNCGKADETPYLIFKKGTKTLECPSCETKTTKKVIVSCALFVQH